MDRLLLFPEPLPDESLYSLAVRYHRMVANNSYRRTSQELFGTYSRTCGSVLPCCLGPLSEQLGGLYSVSDLIDSLTLLPLYRPFLKQAAYESVVRRMEGTQGIGLKMSLGITASGLLKHASFRYCEACIEHDFSHYGVAYWHRIHMAAGVCVCPHHGNVLLSAKLPGGGDWRRMLLPGEFTGTPILSEPVSEAAHVLADMQNWGLGNPLGVCKLLHGDFLRRRLSDMGMLQRGRLRERTIRDYIEGRFGRSAQESEFQMVTGDSEWVMRLLRRRGRVIQPFRYYFLCWLLEAGTDDLRDFYHEPRSPMDSSISPSGHFYKSVSQVEIYQRRQTFIDDFREKVHDKTGYSWLYRHDREWLKKYIGENRSARRIGARVDWAARDSVLSKELVVARNDLMAEKGKPIKITKSALVRGLSYHYGFLRKPSRFPESLKILEGVLESEHDYQLRKVAWAIKKLPLPLGRCTSKIMRLAGIRVKRISDSEIYRVIRSISIG